MCCFIWIWSGFSFIVKQGTAIQFCILSYILILCIFIIYSLKLHKSLAATNSTVAYRAAVILLFPGFASHIGFVPSVCFFIPSFLICTVRSSLSGPCQPHHHGGPVCHPSWPQHHSQPSWSTSHVYQQTFPSSAGGLWHYPVRLCGGSQWHHQRGKRQRPGTFCVLFRTPCVALQEHGGAADSACCLVFSMERFDRKSVCVRTCLCADAVGGKSWEQIR